MKVVIIGAGGHSRVVASILKNYPEIEVVYFFDKKLKFAGEKIDNIPILSDFTLLSGLCRKGINNSIVALGDNSKREKYYKHLKGLGFHMINAIHPTTKIADDVIIGEGVVIAAGSIISTRASIGNNSIINTGAIVDHEVILEDNVHIAPGVNIAGRVVIKRNTFIGIGATVKDYITIGNNVIVGAGSVVIADIPDNSIVAGVPARQINKKKV